MLLTLAYEQPDQVESAHLSACQACGAELAEMRRIVDLGRGGHDIRDLPEPPPHLWQRIEAAIATPPRTPTIWRRPWRWTGTARLVTVGVAAALLGILGTLGVIRATSPDTGRSTVLAIANLQPTNAVAAAARGTVKLIARPNGERQLEVNIENTPRTKGFYEVWLYDGAAIMIPVGSVGAGSDLVLAVPPTADQARFTIIDVSVQILGQQEHGQSILQGTLVPTK
jgi:hypothetical protein